jgi:autotransporter strand-loop-strand O-heptosyltransferase
MDMEHHYFYEEYDAPTKIAYTVWESTELPADFFEHLLRFDYLWVVTDWHKKVAIDQGYPAHRIYVVNEGVDPDFCKDRQINQDERFKFLFFGRWDYRKAVPEIIGSFLNAFPNNEEIDLILSADNPYAIDGMNSTEERLAKYGYNDPRIKVKHFLKREEYINYIHGGHVLVTCARSEGWNIPLIEAMAAGTPVIYSDWGAQLEFAGGRGTPVKIAEERPASIGAHLGFAGNTPGLYAEPNYEHLTEVMKDCYHNWDEKKKKALEEKLEIRDKYSWKRVAEDAHQVLQRTTIVEKHFYSIEEAAVVMSHADSQLKETLLKRCVHNLKRQGYYVIVSSHIPVSKEICDISDVVLIDSDNPVIYRNEYHLFQNTVPSFYFHVPNAFDLDYPFDFNHGFAALRLLQNGCNFSKNKGFQKTHFVNYDYIIEDPMILETHSKLLDEHDFVCYRWDATESVNTGFFSAKTDLFINAISSTKTKTDYLRFWGKTILEDFTFHVLKESEIDIHSLELSFLKDQKINCVLIPTIPSLKDLNPFGKDAVCAFVCHERNSGEILLFLHSANHETFRIEIAENSYISNKYFVILKITEDHLKQGISVFFSKSKSKFYFNENSNRGTINLESPSISEHLSVYSTGTKAELEEPQKYTANINFVDGPFFEMIGKGTKQYNVQFIDKSNGNVVHESILKPNMWTRCNRKYYTDWLIRATDLNTGRSEDYHMDLKDQRVLICIDSSSLGDTLAWFPYVEAFQKKHQCKVVVSTFKNGFFKDRYSSLEFVEPGAVVHNIYAKYQIGWHYNEKGEIDLQMNPVDFRNKPLQASSSDILGLKHTPLRARMTLPPTMGPKISEPYICIAPHSTSQAKYWNNPTGWQELTDHFKSKGYRVIIVSCEGDDYMGNKYPVGAEVPPGIGDIAEAIRWMKYCKMFVGVSSGLSWLAWTMDIPTTVISGFTHPITEFSGKNVIRIASNASCSGCFNNYRLDAGDWNWCPVNKNTEKMFECTKSISGKQVIDSIEKYLNEKIIDRSIEDVIQESYNLGMVQNHKEIYEAASFFKSLNVKSFMEIGTDQGGTFAVWSKLSSDGKRLSLDLPHGTYGRADYNVHHRDEYLKSLGSDVTTLWGDSHSAEMYEKTKEVLGSTLVDFLFIDGDHTYEGVKQDFEMYKQFVKPGGWIGFHDIKNTEFHRNENCRVDLLWSELSGTKIEFVDNTSDYGGIGFIQI